MLLISGKYVLTIGRQQTPAQRLQTPAGYESAAGERYHTPAATYDYDDDPYAAGRHPTPAGYASIHDETAPAGYVDIAAENTMTPSPYSGANVQPNIHSGAPPVPPAAAAAGERWNQRVPTPMGAGYPDYAEDNAYYDHQGLAPAHPNTPYGQAPGRVPSPGYPEQPFPTPDHDAGPDMAYPGEYNETYPLQPYYPPGGQRPQRHIFGLGTPFGTETPDPDDDGTFAPFPVDVQGDEYGINTWEDDGDYEEESTTVTNSIVSSRRSSFVEGGEPMPTEAPPEPVPVPETQPRRSKTFKRVKLFHGNLVLDCPVSTTLLDQLQDPKPAREFKYMRYSAATTDPNDFKANEFTLRQRCYTLPRDTELCICITMYNENDILLGRTLLGVFQNIKHLMSRSRSKTWGRDSWKKVVVCVVADGRQKIHPRAKALMAALGAYQDGFAKNFVRDKPVTAHIYEYTTKVNISSVDKTVKLTTTNTVPVQLLFCLKEKNQKKINSHRWFFSAFGSVLNPKYTILLDAGTRPSKDSFYHLWKAFETNPRVAGACGEITCGLGTGWNKLVNPLVAAQNFEYKMSNILDKPMESSFGFISVLPGAFSAYRYVALLNDASGVGPLASYFKGETLHGPGTGIFTANMYLAEDRILCYELVAKRGCDWVLKYVKSASAETDVPDRIEELVLQRRRWLNGSFFAAVYAQAHALQIWRSAHSLARKLMFHLEFLYQLVSLLFSWFSLGNFFLVFWILTSSIGESALGFAPGKVLSQIFLYVYIACLIATFVFSFGNRPTGTRTAYNLMVIFFAVLMAYLIFAAIYISVKSVQYVLCENDGFSVNLVVDNPTFRDLIISLLSTYALYFLMSFLFFEPWHMFTSFLQYLLVAPSYINVFNVYAFCNIHDISWGTKGDTEQKRDLGEAKTVAGDDDYVESKIPIKTKAINESYMAHIETLHKPEVVEKKEAAPDEKQRDYYARFRSWVVLTWVFSNIALVAIILNVSSSSDTTDVSESTTSSTTGTSTSAVKRAVGVVAYEVFDKLSALVGRAENCGSLGSVGTEATQIYLSVVLWSVAALAAFRAIGALWYLFARLFGR